VAIVGYDDEKAYTDYRDGQVHHGALLMANSWGPDWGVQNSAGAGGKGFFWVAYAALLEHPEGLWEHAWFCTDRPHYRPLLYCVFGMNHAHRGQVMVWGRLGIPFDWFGYTPFWSELNDPLPLTDGKRVAIDFTDGIPTAPGGYPGWLTLQINHYTEDPNSPVTVTSADFYSDLDGDGVYNVDPAIDAPKSFGPTVAWGTVSGIVSDCVPWWPTLPSSMEWEGRFQAAVTFINASDATWTRAGAYALQATDDLDRWGVLSVDLPAAVSVPPQQQATFRFTLTGPPITTLRYALPVTPTSAATVDRLACSWSMVHDDAPLLGPAAVAEVEMSRFPDVQPGTVGAWARFHIEECAGRTPPIVGGYPDGTYRPDVLVSRDQMAVFVQRAMDLPLGAYAGGFSDVAADHWAANQIQSCVDAHIVGGYPDGTYRPEAVVNRDAMAVFVARGLAGGDSHVPSGPATAAFPDVPTGHWAYRYVGYTASRHIVGGYPDGTYRPDAPVARDQMAVFVYRAFIQPNGAAVVLGGPAVTGVDPETADYQGWSSRALGPAAAPGYAYVIFDAVRLDTNLVYPATPEGRWEVRFELRLASSADTPSAGDYSYTLALTSADIESARTAAMATGIPYWPSSWRIPAGLAPGSYLLVVSVSDSTGRRRELPRRAPFTITP